MQVIDKKDVPQEIVVTVEKLSNQGFGIAKYEGFVIFIAEACPKDVVKIRITSKKKSYAYADIVEIIEPSEYRVEPFCKMQKVCGACQLQYIKYEGQLEYKKEIVEDTMKSILGFLPEIKDVIPSPQKTEYRHKIQYPVSETKESKRLIAGYYKSATHDIVNIKYCPIQPACCDEIVEFIRKEAIKFNISGYKEKTHSGILRHILIRVSSINQKSLVVLVVNTTSISQNMKDFAKRIYDNFDNVSGVGININSKKTNLILGEKTEIICGEEYIEEALCDKIFKVGPKTFFQVNPKSADNIFRYVFDYVKTNFETPKILDAYAGIATFGICVSDIAQKVVSIEEVKESTDLALKIIKENNIENIEVYNMDTSKAVNILKNKGYSFDVSIIDPPRKGCSKESLDYLLELTKQKIIYVSCNPATLARDLKYLKDKGANVEYIQPFDMFPHTYHIENVAIIEIKK